MKEAIVLKTFPVYMEDGRIKDLPMGAILRYDEKINRYSGTSDDNTVCTLSAKVVENPDNSKYFYIGPSIPSMVNTLIREVLDKNPTKSEAEILQEILNHVSSKMLKDLRINLEKNAFPLNTGSSIAKYNQFPCSCGNDGTKPCWSTACPNRVIFTYSTSS